jgi:hypothetical protein
MEVEVSKRNILRIITGTIVENANERMQREACENGAGKTDSVYLLVE